jgi:L-alanine-DL-glutamate epimerase-like enolase superfamily enzyme
VHQRPEWRYELFGGHAYEVKGSYVDLPTKPGLGLDLDEAVAAKHPYRPDLRTMWVWPDGSVADN